MARTLTPDICIIGAGAAGLSAAAAAVTYGASVVLVEKSRMGGNHLHHGCIPSKALIAASRHAHAPQSGPPFGIGATQPDVDFAAVRQHIRDTIATLAPNNSAEHFTALGVEVIKAEGRFADGQTLLAGDATVRARRFVIATGSVPVPPPIPGFDKSGCLTDETILDLPRLPEHLIIIGAGARGLEFAQAFRRLGSQVSVIDDANALGAEDPEMTAVILRQLREEGIDIREHTRITHLTRLGRHGVRVSFTTGHRALEGSHLLLATGRAPDLDGLDLGRAGIVHGEWGLKLDTRLRTTNHRVYAIGDAAGAGESTAAARTHGELVVRAILFRLPLRVRPSMVPRIIFTDPELAHVGLTETEAAAKHRRLRVLRWPYAESDRAHIERSTHGHIKVVADSGGRILGASIAGPIAGEMIHIWSLALAKGLTLRDMASYIAPYPSWGEIGKHAAITYLIAAARMPFARRLIGILRKFG